MRRLSVPLAPGDLSVNMTAAGDDESRSVPSNAVTAAV